MKNPSDYLEYQAFCTRRKKDLQRIAGHTRGTHEISDVEIEAWLMAEHMQSTKAIRIDWNNPEDQALLLSYLYQHLVRYTEQHHKYAVRLDHWIGDDMEDGPHPLLNKLVADDGADPLMILSMREDALKTTLKEPDCHHSLASAYIHLLRRFDNRMRAVAEHLLISVSYCYRHYAKVKMLAELQRPIPLYQPENRSDFIPKAWRRFRLRRTPLQLAFDFEVERPLALGTS